MNEIHVYDYVWHPHNSLHVLFIPHADITLWEMFHFSLLFIKQPSSLLWRDCFWDTNSSRAAHINDSIMMSGVFDNWFSPFNFPCQPWSPLIFRSLPCSPITIVFLKTLRGNRSWLLSSWCALKYWHRNAMHPLVNARIALN